MAPNRRAGSGNSTPTISTTSAHTQPLKKGIATCREARKLLAGLGALDLSDMNATTSWADTADSEARFLAILGRPDEARKLEQQVYELAEKVLARRPGNLHALADRYLAADVLSSLAFRRHDAAAAAQYAGRAVRAGADEVRFNPSDLGSWRDWVQGLRTLADVQFRTGEVTKAIATLRSLLALEQDPRRPSSLAPIAFSSWIDLAFMQSEAGESEAAAQSAKFLVRDAAEAEATLSADDGARKLLTHSDRHILAARLQLDQGHWQSALATARAEIAEIDPISVQPGTSAYFAKNDALRENLGTAALAAIQLGRYAEAEAFARRWLALPIRVISANPQTLSSIARVTLAHALARQGRNDEALKTLQPALAWYRQEQHAGASDMLFRHHYAYALYVSAIASPAKAAGARRRKAALVEASKLIAGASAEARRTASMRRVSNLIASANAPH